MTQPVERQSKTYVRFAIALSKSLHVLSVLLTTVALCVTVVEFARTGIYGLFIPFLYFTSILALVLSFGFPTLRLDLEAGDRLEKLIANKIGVFKVAATALPDAPLVSRYSRQGRLKATFANSIFINGLDEGQLNSVAEAVVSESLHFRSRLYSKVAYVLVLASVMATFVIVGNIPVFRQVEREDTVGGAAFLVSIVCIALAIFPTKRLFARTGTRRKRLIEADAKTVQQFGDPQSVANGLRLLQKGQTEIASSIPRWRRAILPMLTTFGMEWHREARIAALEAMITPPPQPPPPAAPAAADA